ncbi:MAG: OmpH family outer membrane protein, partial [Bacteroidales bacterium]|nr:OmpH family outer membrane protein [Bacteroidales bacterium]
MKKLVVSAMIALMAVGSSFAQKYALIDMEYIFSRIPSYEMANEQLNQISKKWQAEVDALAKEAKEMYAKYQSEMVYLSAEMKKTKENEILAKEKEVSDLNRKYFGSEG